MSIRQRTFASVLTGSLAVILLASCSLFQGTHMTDDTNLTGQALLDSIPPEVLYSEDINDPRIAPTENLTWALLDDMMASPSLEVQTVEDRALLSEIVDQITVEIPDLVWTYDTLPMTLHMACAHPPFTWTQSETAHQVFHASRVVDDHDWDIIADIVTRVGQAHGYDMPPVTSRKLGDGSRNYATSGYTDHRANLEVGVNDITTWLGVETRCLLPERIRTNLITTGIPEPAYGDTFWPFPKPADASRYAHYATEIPTDTSSSSPTP